MMIMTFVFSAFLAVGIRVGFLISLIVVGLPIVGKTMVETGIRIKDDALSNRCIKWGSMLLAAWVCFAIPISFYVFWDIVRSVEQRI